jgi:hypothetical protein
MRLVDDLCLHYNLSIGVSMGFHVCERVPNEFLPCESHLFTFILITLSYLFR